MNASYGKVKSFTMTRANLFVQAAVLLQPLLAARFVSDEAAGMMLPALLLYTGIGGGFLCAARRRVYRFIRIYMTGKFYINVRDTSRQTMLKTLAVTLPAALAVIFEAEIISVVIAGSFRARMALYVSAAAVVICGFEGVLYGTAEGMGGRRFAFFCDVVKILLLLTLTVPAALAGADYGRKTDALLGTTDCTAAFAALAVTLLLLLSDVIIMVLLAVFRLVCLFSLSPLEEKGLPRYIGEKPVFYEQISQLLLAMFVPSLLTALTRMFFYFSDSAPLKENPLLCAGLISGHLIPLTGLTGIFFAYIYVAEGYRMPGMGDEVDRSDMGIRFSELMHRMFLSALPAGAFVTALSGVIETAVFVTPPDEAVKLLRAGGMLVPLYAFAIIICMMLVLTKRLKALALDAVSSFAAGIAAAALVSRFMHNAVWAYALPLMFCMLVFDIAGIAVMCRLLQVKSRMVFVKLFMLPFLISVLFSLFALLLSAFLVNVVGEALTCMICIIAGGAFYLLLVAFFRGLTARDLKHLPFGTLFVRVSQRP